MTLDERLEKQISPVAFDYWKYHFAFRRMQKWNAFKDRKEELIAQFKELRCNELVGRQLLPDYDLYEERVSKFFQNEMKKGWPFIGDILKSKEFPRGGGYSILRPEIPNNIFADIPDSFISSLNLELKLYVVSVDHRDYCWRNMELDYNRKKFIESVKAGKKGRLSAKLTLVLPFRAFPAPNKHRFPTLIVMALLCRAYNDACLVNGNYLWASNTLGRMKYRDNSRKLMGMSDDMCLHSMYDLFHSIHEMESRMNVSDDVLLLTPEHTESPVDTVSQLMEKVNGTRTMHQLRELEGKLESTLRLVENYEEDKLVGLWNRCSRAKVSSKKDIVSMLKCKVDTVISNGLFLLFLKQLVDMVGDPFDTMCYEGDD